MAPSECLSFDSHSAMEWNFLWHFDWKGFDWILALFCCWRISVQFAVGRKNSMIKFLLFGWEFDENLQEIAWIPLRSIHHRWCAVWKICKRFSLNFHYRKFFAAENSSLKCSWIHWILLPNFQAEVFLPSKRLQLARAFDALSNVWLRCSLSLEVNVASFLLLHDFLSLLYKTETVDYSIISFITVIDEMFRNQELIRNYEIEFVLWVMLCGKFKKHSQLIRHFRRHS